MADLAASVIFPNKNNVWIDDNLVSKCQCCNMAFGIVYRKHHCRCCGNIFCDNCCNNYIEIPKSMKCDCPKEADTWNPSYYIRSWRSEKKRVCASCRLRIIGQIQDQDSINNLNSSPQELSHIKCDPTMSNNVKTHYFDYFRNIQYYLPNHIYTDYDKKILQVNMHSFAGHSKYIVHMLKSIDWQNQVDLTPIIPILVGERTHSCADLYCTRTCCDKLAFDDCINILYTCAYTLPDCILKLLFSLISEATEEIILSHLVFFVNLMKRNKSNEYLAEWLHKILLSTPRITYRSFWFAIVTSISNTGNDLDGLSNVDRFMSVIEPSTLLKMKTEHHFFMGLMANLDNVETYLKKILKCPITLPYDPNYEIIGYNSEEIDVKNSNSKPVVIPFIVKHKKTLETSTIKILFKNEPVMTDILVLDLMYITSIILTDGLDFGETKLSKYFEPVIYSVLPITPDSGMINIIDNARTLYDIQNNKETILQYITSKNPNELVGVLLDRYTCSLVSYTLQNYFMGIGDRHLQNIMIKDNGRIFHIDFGFILGQRTNLMLGSEIRLNSDMLDAVGNQDSERYITYLELCSQGAIILRKHFNTFFILLCQDKKFNPEDIKEFILKRFQPRKHDSEVVDGLIDIIRQSNDAFAEKIRDLIHRQTQEQTVQNGLYNFVNFTYNLFASLGSNDS